LKQTYKTTN